MKVLRILVLVHEELLPPTDLEGYSDQEINNWATEYDVVEGLQALGHDVYLLGVGDDLMAISEAFAETRPHLVFNLLVHFHGIANYDQHLVSYLELLKMPYTGCNPRGLMLARDKGLSKKLLASEGILVPQFKVFRRKKAVRRPANLPFPLLVKSLNEEASLGISQASVVSNDKKLKERISFVHETLGVDAIAEQYVEGRELYVGVLGNERLTAFPLWELPFEQLPKGTHHIATARLKWDLKYQTKHHIETQRARGISSKQETAIANMAKSVYRCLGLSGYARMDLRMNSAGEVYVLEANPNPDLKYGEDFAESAHSAGVDYPKLLTWILRTGLAYQAEWKSLQE